ncbi:MULTISPECIES: AmmeMemoRadiSam system radical SAM enzyme [Oceanotoga]|uniref:Pyruvate formate lyase activating enzyme n=1 Tax=Oceanotoga teriensis TaxID=515440 RepID=A0AA45HIT7_9BACT|nr:MULTISPECIES: AmmeMemoRadiSam system radical SAM enzyme [Oceanotoga]MDN5343072.1 pyruvate formate lyase activating enzyme [Oceanotoga sp.]MDO7976718.1 AmmeMemoRadiSam system radical SAM enzyme [Oceanotoga teriensis]PWJ95239.1 pyruvate formate lyase activating enzyme [Oceanotoga teriensis]
MNMNALFSSQKEEGILCNLCPHECIIEENKTGFCKTRKNISSELNSINYAEVTGFEIEPIEKKPLFHFKPGKNILSLGSWGCNLICPYCQNHEISQEIPAYSKKIYPNAIPNLIEKYKVGGIAFTYSEPIVWFEYVLDACREIKNYDLDIYTIMVSNGYIKKEPLELLLQYIDAFNIDLKTFDSETYKKIFNGDLEKIKENIKIIFEKNAHIEITTLIVPDINENLQELEEEFKWISSLSSKIPLHINKYFPRYKYSKKATDIGKLIEIYQIAKKHLEFVYIGNIWDPKYESTYCPECGELLVERKGYNIKIVNLNENGGCIKCGRKVMEM